LTRSIVWYHRTKPTDQEGRETPFVDLSGLSGGWGGMQLQSSRGVVLSTSFDGKRLLCLSLIDGRERWGMSSSEPAYVAGVCDKGVVIVSRRSIYCLGLEEKETAWKLKLDAKEVPGGRGALGANGMLYVPTNEGSLLRVDCNEGKIVGRERIEPARGDELGLGNLVLTENELVGVNGEEIRTFETRQSMESAERSRNASSLSEAQKRILEGERLVGEKKYGEAWSVLRSIERDQLTADQRKGLDERERLVLLTGLKEGGEYDAWRAYLHEKIFDEKTSGGKRTGNWKLGVAGIRWLEGIGKKEEAWGLLLRLIEEEGLETELIVESDQPRYEVRADLVAAGLLKRIWEQSTEEERKRLDEMPATQQEFAGGSDVERLERRLRLFGFHPLAREWRKDLFQQLFTAGEFHRAEGVLLKELADLDRQFAGDREKEAGAIVEQLAGLMVLAGVPEDAEWYREKYGIKKAEKSGESSGDLLKWGSRAPNWKGEELKMSVEGGIGNGYPSMEIPIREAAAPSARRWRWQIVVLQQRLLARSNETERIEWGVPLRNRDPILELRGRSWIDGHLTAVELGGMLQGVSILDRKLLWSVPTSSEGNYDAEMFYTEDGPVFPIHPVHILPLKNMNLRQHLPVVYNGPKMGLAAKSSSRLCLRERGGVICLDSITGRTMWRLQGVSNETVVIGGEEVVYLIHPNTLEGEARRMEDGSRLRDRETGEQLELKRLLRRTVSVSGGDLIVRGEIDADDVSKKGKGSVPLSLRGPLEDGLRTKALLEKSGLLGNGKGGTVRLSRYRPETGETLWSTEIPGGACVGEVSAGNLLVIDEAGEKEERVWDVRMLSMRDGSFRSLGTMNPQPIRSLHQRFMRIYAHQAGGMLFLGASQGNDDMYSEDLVSMMDVNGPFGVFDVDQGKPLWQMTIRSTKLVLNKLERSPVLIFTEKSAPLGGTGGWKRDVRVVDRFTGREMLNEQITSDDQLIQVEIDTRDRGVRLVCSGEVLGFGRGGWFFWGGSLVLLVGGCWGHSTRWD
ncbi:MAG: PQQ-binding-like beta-propeller repeat protein, partial [Planctomycetaceae bacterium]|nr:PQQ-binding-like beta-propeller repeat protein [Planctomycetaceae bacterium]